MNKNNNLQKKITIIILIVIMCYAIIGILNISNATTIKTMKIVIDPGHGGHETGAVNTEYGILEKDINLKTAEYLKEYLNNYYGTEIIMTHEGLSNDCEMSIVDRGMCARNNNADLLLCLHFNASDSGDEWHGAEVYVTNNESCYKYKRESTEIGNKILENLSNLGLTNRGVKTRLCNDEGDKWMYSDGSKADYYGIIRYAMKGDSEGVGLDITQGLGITSILIEHCFMRGGDYNFINSDEKLKSLAEADGKAIVQHYNLQLKHDIVSQIIFDKTNININKNSTEKINATITPDTAKNKKLNWSSSNNEIATVDENGNVKALSEGTACITATADGNDKVSQTATINVFDPKITIENGSENNIIENSRLQLYVDKGQLTDDVIWKSSDELVATVDENGIVDAIKEGTTEITANIDKYNIKSTIKINVNKLKDTESIIINNYKENNGTISCFERETSYENFLKNIQTSENLKVKIRTTENQNSSDLKYVGSGTIIDIYDENDKIIQSYICKLYGDINGDGKISAIDYVLIKNKILEIKDITAENKKDVADVNADGKISAIDYVLIMNDILEKKKIEVK